MVVVVVVVLCLLSDRNDLRPVEKTRGRFFVGTSGGRKPRGGRGAVYLGSNGKWPLKQCVGVWLVCGWNAVSLTVC